MAIVLEKASIFQGAQIGVETTPGVAAPANKKLMTVSVNTGYRGESKTVRPSGYKYATASYPLKEWGGFSINGDMTYNELVYILAGLLDHSAPTQQGATPAYKWTFDSLTSEGDDTKSFTIEQGDENSAWRLVGARYTGVTLNFSRTGATIQGDGIGTEFEEGITLTPNPTELDPIMVLPTQLKLYAADTMTGLNSAQALTRSFSFEWSVTNKLGLAWPIGTAPFAIESEPTNTAKIRLATDTYGMSYINDLRDAKTKWFKLVAIGPTISGVEKHKLTLTFPAKVEGVGDFTDMDNVFVVDYSLKPIHDADWGKSLEIEIISDVSAL